MNLNTLQGAVELQWTDTGTLDLLSNDRLSDVSLLLTVENRTVIKGIGRFFGGLITQSDRIIIIFHTLHAVWKYVDW